MYFGISRLVSETASETLAIISSLLAVGRKRWTSAVPSDLIAASDPQHRQVVRTGNLGNGVTDGNQERPFGQVHLEYRVEGFAEPTLQTHRHGQGDSPIGGMSER